MSKATPNWGMFFRIKKVGFSTYYVVYIPTGNPVSPDFRERRAAWRWIRANWQDTLFEQQVLK